MFIIIGIIIFAFGFGGWVIYCVKKGGFVKDNATIMSKTKAGDVRKTDSIINFDEGRKFGSLGRTNSKQADPHDTSSYTMMDSREMADGTQKEKSARKTKKGVMSFS